MKWQRIKVITAIGAAAVGGGGGIASQGVQALAIPTNTNGGQKGVPPSSSASSSSSSSSSSLSSTTNLVEEYLPLVLDDLNRMDEKLDQELSQMFEEFEAAVPSPPSASTSTRRREAYGYDGNVVNRKRPSRVTSDRSSPRHQQHNTKSSALSASSSSSSPAAASHKAISDIRGGGKTMDRYDLFGNNDGSNEFDYGGLLMEEVGKSLIVNVSCIITYHHRSGLGSAPRRFLPSFLVYSCVKTRSLI